MDEARSENFVKVRDENSEDKYRVLAAMSFMIVVVLIGVPMWWKTTEVYRATLPSDKIVGLSEKPIKLAATISIFTFNANHGKLLQNELTAKYFTNDIWNLTFVRVPQIERADGFKTPAALEKSIVKTQTQQAGDFLFMEWPQLKEKVLLTTGRSAYIRTDSSAELIINILDTVLLQTNRLNNFLTQDKLHSFKSEAPQSAYDVVVSVINPRPDMIDVQWNVQMAVENYLSRFLREVSHISNYTLKTQWKFVLPFEADLKQIRDKTEVGRHYALPESALPHIITSIEKNLGVGISDRTSINLVVYVPPCDISPLYIYNNAGEKATNNQLDSFISDRWGGIIIVNPSENVCLTQIQKQQPVKFHINSNDVMQIMLHQLHNLLDIKVDVNLRGVEVVDFEDISPHRWAYEAYLRRSAVMHITTATKTLQSLIKLLDNINYIVINDEVGAAINEAYEYILLGKDSLANGMLLQASLEARRAFLAAENAFFDAGLLTQLYFPDEQKYAIYIPLFLPIMVPVLTSFSTLRKLQQKLRNKN